MTDETYEVPDVSNSKKAHAIEFPITINDLYKEETVLKMADFVLKWGDGAPKWGLKKVPKKDIYQGAGVSKRSATRNTDKLVDYGIATAKGENAPRYKPNIESEVFQLITEINNRLHLVDVRDIAPDEPSPDDFLPLSFLFRTETRRVLIDYIFGEWWDELFEPNADREWLTIAEVAERSGLIEKSVADHIDVLVEYGLLERTNNDTYRVDGSSYLLHRIPDLNEALTEESKEVR